MSISPRTELRLWRTSVWSLSIVLVLMLSLWD